MVGVAGRSGGARANSGGARPGAGRKPKAVVEKSANKRGASVETKLEPQAHGGALKREKSVPVELPERDMLTLLKDIALGRVEASAGQIRAAIAAVQYTHVKRADGGKKEEGQEAAKKAAAGKFAAASAPRLVANGGRKV
ncbi:hypothetical protein [Undibacterium baiyunense]|uniref:Uncharacterized protein n=1 Tax=Undibacterium baiyunense TaxID=2828731 RepID=A0A941DEU7_9BURK|nr:hypothetical protein [Undibacterium baiyunense]MBR7747449.1 hypothetical protein [Undibacterium baiyunense]